MCKRSSEKSSNPNIKNAAELFLKCAGFLNDRDAAVRNDDRQLYTYYALDTDVVTLYIAPIEKADYLNIFTEDKGSLTSKSLAFLLGDFLIASSEPLIQGHERQPCRFLIIPPHDEELLRLLTAIHRKLCEAPDAVTEIAFKNLSDTFTKYDKDLNDDALLAALKNNVPDLAELLNPYLGPKAELTRYAKLPATTLQGIATYLKDGFTFPIGDPINNKKDREIVNPLIKQWEIRLKAHMPSKKPPYALKRDAEVLATIEYVNESLYNNDRKQIVLITGSDYLFRASEDYKPPWHHNNHDIQTFAELYLRHPQAFLVHPNFFPYFRDFKDEPFKLIDWLNLFFPSGWPNEISSMGVINRHFLHSIQTGKSQNYNGVIRALTNANAEEKPINGLITTWQVKVASLANTQFLKGLEKAEERGAIELAKKLKQLRNNHNWDISSLRELMFRESIEATSALYSKTVWVGLWTHISRLQSKGVPALRFDPDFKKIEEYCRKVVKLQLDNVNKQISTEALKNLYEFSKEVENEDQSFYHAHVVHALAFATKGHWYATLTLAKIAIAIADNIVSINKEIRGRIWIRGREAAYLACIAERRSARNRSGLNAAANYLNQAIERENPGQPEDIRFKEERLALETRMYYFDFFCDSKNPDIQDLSSTIDNLYELVNITEREENLYVKLWVYRQALTNFFTLLLMALKIQMTDKLPSSEKITKCLHIFKYVLNEIKIHHHKPEDEPYTHLIFHISTVVWASDPEERKSHNDNALQALKNWNAFYMPYDTNRIKFLKQYVS